jgi:thioredoxin reductase (NADPH)
MNTIYDIIIVGAGPAGIEAALQAKRRGLSSLLLDKHDAGWLIESTMANKKFHRAFGAITDPHRGLLEFPDRTVGKDLVALWKKQIAGSPFLPRTEVTQLHPEDGIFEITTTNGIFKAKHIIIATGTFETHKLLGVEGEGKFPGLFYSLDYEQKIEGKRVIVAGGGNSALETATRLAPQNTVHLLVRKSSFAPNATPENVSRANELASQGKLAIWYGANIESIGEREISVSCGGQKSPLPYDLLFVHIGFEKPTEFLKRIGVAPNIPNLFIAGSLAGADSILSSANQSCAIVETINESE